MRLLATILFLCSVVLSAKAQRRCGTVGYAQQGAFALNRPVGNASTDTVLNQRINIPVIIHVLYNTAEQNISDAQILSQLAVLNEDYNRLNADTVMTPNVFKPLAGNAKISFCLARLDVKGRATTGIIRTYTTQQSFTANDAMKYSAQGGDDAWDCTKYLNIWVCNLDSISLGYGTFPGGPADRDGVVVGYNVFGTVGVLRTPFNKGRTATHEIGHWLGLKHTWGDAICGDDSIADTPQQEYYNTGCPSFPHLSACSPNANGDMFMDFMDFTDDGCMNMFTVDQVMEMKSLFVAGGPRSSFLNAYQCDSLMPQGGALPQTPSGIDTVVVQPTISVYPNPAHEKVTIETSGFSVIGKTAYLYTATGIKILDVPVTQPKITVNLSGVPAGIYILRIGEVTNVFTAKIIHL